MLRNTELKAFLGIQGLVMFAGSGLAAVFFSAAAAVYVLFLSTLLVAGSVLFTAWRYREIKKLSGYLHQISGGNHTLDIRDNREGELSILKNDIYKVTMMLSEQGSHLQKDKLMLIDAISDISHQLKTPLTSMTMMADLLSNPKLDGGKRVEFTRIIRVQLERIDWLVSSLLKLSKIDAGAVRFRKDPVPVPALVQKALEPVLIPMDIKEQKLQITGDAEVSFKGDLNWTTEALTNILKNCVEHTGEGGTIKISYSENALYTELIISDDGKGIMKKDLPYIFKRFYKGENASDDSVGIGLAMAYSIITGQNGDISVSSEPGKGTRFGIKFYKQVV